MKKESIYGNQQIAFFKRWQNKKYSVFNSLRKVVKISCLLLTYFMFESFGAKAQIDTIHLQDIIINSYKAPVLYSEKSRVVSIIRKDEISNAPVTNINDLLKAALSVDIRQRGAEGMQSDISIRGGTFEQTLILLNGIKINDPQTGHHNLNLPIDIEAVDRIEILEGPGARVYGPNAFSGAVNIITLEKDKNFVRAHIQGGEYNLYGATVTAGIKIGQVKHFVSLSKKACDGYMIDTDFEIKNLFYQLQYKSNFGLFDIQAGYTDKAFGAYKFYSVAYPNQFEQTKTTFASVKFSTGKKLKFNSAFYWRRNTDRFMLFRNHAPTWYTSPSFHLTDIYGIDLNTYTKTAIGRVAFGIDARSENILSNSLGETLSEPVAVKNENNYFYTKSKTRQNINLFAEDNFSFGNFNFSVGLLANWYENYKWNFFPGADVSYSFDEKHKIFFSYNQTLRVPTFTELFYIQKDKVGNKELLSEKATSYEIGTCYQHTWFDAHISYFYRKATNVIDWIRPNTNSIWKCDNLTEINTNGIEFSLNFYIKKIYNSDFFIDFVRFGYSYLEITREDNNFISSYALDYLKHNLSVHIQHTIYGKLKANWQFIYQNRAGSYTNSMNQEVAFNQLNILNTKLFYKFSFFEAYLLISNVFDQRYVDFANLEMPGRWLKAGIVFEIEK